MTHSASLIRCRSSRKLDDRSLLAFPGTYRVGYSSEPEPLLYAIKEKREERTCIFKPILMKFVIIPSFISDWASKTVSLPACLFGGLALIKALALSAGRIITSYVARPAVV